MVLNGIRTVIAAVATAPHGRVVITSSAAMAMVVGTLAGCAGPVTQPGEHHLAARRAGAMSTRSDSVTGEDIPAVTAGVAMPPRPKLGAKLDTYSVVVSQVEISELLFAMGRDAKLNVDVHPAIKGKVTINAVNQTLPQILSRMARQVDLRYEFDGKNLIVTPDSVFVKHYKVDYVNISRDSRANTSIATQIASTGRDPLSSGGSSGAGQMSNNSTTQISNTSNNHFWSMLVGNLRSLLSESAAGGGAGGGAGGAVAAGADGARPAVSAAGVGAASGGGGTAQGAASAAGGTAAAARSASPATGSDGSGRPQGGGTDGSRLDAPKVEQPSVIASPETGLVTVRASQRQHELVQQYLDKVMSSARRQVLIEATIAEVQLSDQFQQGVNWSRMRFDGTGWSFAQQPMGTQTLGGGTVPNGGPGGMVFSQTPGATTLPGGANLTGNQTPSLGILRYLNSTSGFGNVGFAVSLLQSFGKVKVLSSPKISVLNNQTAVLKVVDNRVYFTIGVQVTPGTAGSAAIVTYTSSPNTVPVGFVMSVTPQIEESGGVTINVRPTISRILGYVNDPNPALAANNVTSRIPEIQTREMESILKVNSGDVAVMGGLMQESVSDQHDGIPGASGVPLFGNLFKYRNDLSNKTELVVFLRPIVIRDASLEGDYRSLKGLLPGEDFFSNPSGPDLPRAWRSEPVKADGAIPPVVDAPKGDTK